MDFALSPEQELFRHEVRLWASEHVGRDVAPRQPSERVAFERAWQCRLAEAGLVSVHWPKEHGGRGLGWTENFILQEELALAGAPEIINRVGVNLVGPTLIAHGTEEQRVRFLPGIVRAAELWCQLFSEPEAGSDLRSMRTEAERVAGGWRIRGQKVWVSNAQYADFGILLARLAEAHGAIGFFLLDVRQDGVDIRPLRQMTGEAEFNEIFLDGAFVPDDQVVGDPHEGWSIANTTLGFERATSPRQLIVHVGLLQQLLTDARAHGVDPVIRQQLARHYSDLLIYRLHLYRVLTDLEQGRTPGADSSLIKLWWSEMAQRMHETSMRMLGADATVGETRRQRNYLYYRACTIFAGTSEIQRNTLAERVLGLPRERRQGLREASTT
jgi:alkylation response protein AidB-like acyl-CoA dehydrogenase